MPYQDALARAQIDGVLQEWHEHHLRDEEGDAKQRQPGLEEEHVADHAQQDAALQQRLGDAGADEAVIQKQGLRRLQDSATLPPCPAGTFARVPIAGGAKRGLSHSNL